MVNRSSVVDRHLVEADPDPDPAATLMPIYIRIWILPQVLNKFLSTFLTAVPVPVCITIILIGVKCVLIFNILKSVLNFFDKKASWALHLYEMER